MMSFFLCASVLAVNFISTLRRKIENTDGSLLGSTFRSELVLYLCILSCLLHQEMEVWLVNLSRVQYQARV